MQPQTNISLSQHSTMRLGGPAKYLLEINSAQQIKPAVEWALDHNCKLIMIGDGSNIVWNDEGFDGLVLVNKILGFDLDDKNDHAVVVIGAGENWDKVVERTVEAGFSGIENLSLIPGTAGATPIQNVGAYGKEIADTLVHVEAFDTHENKMVTIPNNECGFSYRKSRFNGDDKGRFLITGIVLKLTKTQPTPPFYGALQSYLDDHDITNYTIAAIREAVIAVRNSKLPNPAHVANCGSFFANPIIDNAKLAELLQEFPDLPNWQLDEQKSKISAAWIMENLGYKGHRDTATGMAIWDKHALVLVNENAANTASLLAFRDSIIDKAKAKFGITLHQEPELI